MTDKTEAMAAEILYLRTIINQGLACLRSPEAGKLLLDNTSHYSVLFSTTEQQEYRMAIRRAIEILERGA